MHHRGSRASRRAAQQQLRARRRFIAGLAAVGIGLTGGAVALGTRTVPTDDRVVVILEKSTAAPAGLSSAIRERAYELSDEGAGTLVLYAVGEEVSAPVVVPLAIVRDNEPEPDPRLRHAAVDRLLTRAVRAVDDQPVGATGFSLAAAVQKLHDVAADDDAGEAWVQSVVLTSTIDPIDMHALAPGQAHAAARSVLDGTSVGRLDLTGLDVHVVLLAPTGPGQRPLSPLDEQWRTTFLDDLCTGLHARVERPEPGDDLRGGPWRRATAVPPVQPRDEPTPPLTPDVDGNLPEVVDSAAFVGDQARLENPETVRPALQRIVERYRHADGRYRVTVTGYTAHLGTPAGALALSEERAEVIRRQLIEDIPAQDVAAEGRGFDEIAVPDADPASPAQRVVIIRLVPRSG